MPIADGCCLASSSIRATFADTFPPRPHRANARGSNFPRFLRCPRHGSRSMHLIRQGAAGGLSWLGTKQQTIKRPLFSLSVMPFHTPLWPISGPQTDSR